MSTFEFDQVTATTDANGYFSFTFDGTPSTAMVSVNQPQAGGSSGLVSASIQQTGTKTWRVRCWRTTSSPDNWSVEAAANEQVTVTILGLIP